MVCPLPSCARAMATAQVHCLAALLARLIPGHGLRGVHVHRSVLASCLAMSPALYRRLLPARSEQEFSCLQSDSVWILSLTCRRLPQRSAAKHALATARGRGDCSSKAQGLQERAGPASQSGHPRHASSTLFLLLNSLCAYDSQAG